MKIEKKPRILMLYDFPIMGGGSGPYIKSLSLRLKKAHGYECAIAAPDETVIDPSLPQYTIKLPQIPVFIGRPGLEGAKKYSELTSEEILDLYYAFISETMKIVKEFKPDIIHVHHLIINLWAARFIKTLFGIKYVATSHGSDVFAIAKDRRYFLLTRDALRGASGITVVSGDTRAKLKKMFGSDLSKKIRTIPGGVRLNLFPESKSEAELTRIKQQYQLTDAPIVLFTGRLINEKGIEYIVKAAGKIKGQIVLVGDGPQRKAIDSIIVQRKLTNVHLLGYMESEKLIELYYIADVFVSPSVWDDPMPLTIIEAMAAGLPVVVTRRGGIPIAVKDGFNGFFVRPRNATDIAEKVNKLLENVKLRERLGKNARLVVQEKFTWTKIADKFDNVYRKLK